MPVAHALQRRVKAWKAESDNGLLSDNPSSTSGCSDTAVADEVEGTFSSDSDHESNQNREEDQVRRQQTKSLSSNMTDRP